MARNKPAAQPRVEAPTEAEQVAAAPVVETETPAPVDPAAELEKEVQELFSQQFGGEDRSPQEGVTPWDNMVREMAVEADRLQTEYERILKAKEDNRTLLRAFVGMDKLPEIVANYYYPPRKRLTKAEKAAQQAQESAS